MEAWEWTVEDGFDIYKDSIYREVNEVCFTEKLTKQILLIYMKK